MPFVVVGVEHSTAPLAVRERVSPGPDERDGARRIFALDPSDEVVILATCNRTEVYVHTLDPARAVDGITSWMVQRAEDVLPSIRVRHDLDAVEHLFRVACGLESQVPGERQILSQVAAALDAAQRAGMTGSYAHALFRAAVACSRTARLDTSLGQVDRSIGAGAVAQAAQHLSGFRHRSVVIVGGGEVSRVVAREVALRDPARLVVANRTTTVAEEIATAVGAEWGALDDLPEMLAGADLVFSATAAPSYVVRPDDCRLRTSDSPLLLYDLASPRDIDPSLADLPGVTVVDLDALGDAAPGERWAADVQKIEAVIAAAVHEFEGWIAARRVAPVIASLRRHVEAVSRAELERAAPQLSDLTPREHAAVETLTNRLIDKMFHHLVVRLRLAAQTDPALVNAAEFFFLHGPGGLFEDEALRQNHARTEVHTE
jgi:glutamyl-tRNA reductase